jgi:hypothetical protein
MTQNEQIIEVPEEFIGSAEKLEVVRPALDALAEEEVRPLTLQVVTAVMSAIRLWQSYVADKALFVANFTALGFDAAGLQNFPLRISALWYTDVILGQAFQHNRALPKEVAGEAKPLHAKLAAAALYLFKNDPILIPQVRSIREGSGYLDMADDLVRYAALFATHWDDVKNRCDVTEIDLQSAKRLSPVILEGLTAIPAKEMNARKDLRNRAGEYLCRGAEDIREAAFYLFRKKPAALTRYPSLYIARGPARKKADGDEQTEGGVETQSTQSSARNAKSK